MAITHIFAGVAVADYGSARLWYERLFGRAPDMLPNENEAVWRVAQTGSIYIVGDPDHAGRALLTLAADDLDELVAGLADRGIPGVIDSVPAAGRPAAG